jgi:hypothetical protein
MPMIMSSGLSADGQAQPATIERTVSRVKIILLN